jgi:hypothetical protein
MSSPFGMPPGVSAAMPAQSHNPMPQNPTTQMEDRLTVGPCIISYPALFVPKHKMNMKEGPKSYGAEFIVLMETPEQHAQAQQIYQRMMAVANTVAQHKFQRNADAFRNKCLRPLSERKGFENRPGFFFSAKTGEQYKPDVLVGNPPVVATDPDQVYAGAIVYCTIKAGTYDEGGNQGVKWYLNSVLKVGDGPRLAGDRDAASDYADILASMPVSQPAPVYAPPGYAAPPAYPPQAYGQPAAPAIPYGVPPVQQQYAAPPAFQSPPMPGYPGFPQ